MIEIKQQRLFPCKDNRFIIGMTRKILLLCVLSLIVFVAVRGADVNFNKTEIYRQTENDQTVGDGIHGVRKIKDIIIYKDTVFFSSFPSVIKRPDGEIIVVFRRAPDRKIFSEKYTNHVDPNSYLMMVRSCDGEHFTKKPELIHAHPFGGSAGPSLLQLRDGTLLCMSYAVALVRQEGIPKLKKPYIEAGGTIFLGGYYIRSMDGGETWSGPEYPPHIAPEIHYDAFGKPLPAYNYGTLCEGKSGRIFWVVAAQYDSSGKSSTHLITSDDKGRTWQYSCPVAVNEKASFSETSVYETPKGDIVAFLRTAKMDDQACIARSTDGGRSFKWQKMGFQGHPLNAMRLPDNRVLLTYGYRHKPYGIRARVLNPECTDFATAPEMVIRDDGGTEDMGYAWPVQLDGNRVLVVYYFNKNDGTRYIAGTILELDR